MITINFNDILYVWNIHYDILSIFCTEKFRYVIYTKILLYTYGIYKLSISGIDNRIFVYITYGHFSIHIIH